MEEIPSACEQKKLTFQEIQQNLLDRGLILNDYMRKHNVLVTKLCKNINKQKLCINDYELRRELDNEHSIIVQEFEKLNCETKCKLEQIKKRKDKNIVKIEKIENIKNESIHWKKRCIEKYLP